MSDLFPVPRIALSASGHALADACDNLNARLAVVEAWPGLPALTPRIEALEAAQEARVAAEAASSAIINEVLAGRITPADGAAQHVAMAANLQPAVTVGGGSLSVGGEDVARQPAIPPGCFDKLAASANLQPSAPGVVTIERFSALEERMFAREAQYTEAATERDGLLGADHLPEETK